MRGVRFSAYAEQGLDFEKLLRAYLHDKVFRFEKIKQDDKRITRKIRYEIYDKGVLKL